MIIDLPTRTAWLQSASNVIVSSTQNTFLNIIQPWVEQVVWKVLGYSLEQNTYTEYVPSALSERPPLSFGLDVGWDLVGGVVLPRSRTDAFEGSVQLSNLPIRSITTIYENVAAWTGGTLNGDWPAESLLPPTAYRLDMQTDGLCLSGRVYRIVGAWSSISRSVKVTYTAGYTQAEIDASFGPVKMAVLMGLNWWLGKAVTRSKAMKNGGMIPYQVAVRDFSATLGDPSGMSATPGPWAQNVLGPESLMMLAQYQNLAKYLGNM